MSVYSTLYISRQSAELFITHKLRDLTDQQVELIVDQLLDKHLYNANINYCPKREDEQVLNSLS